MKNIKKPSVGSTIRYVVGIVAIAVIVVVALLQGVDGAVTMSGIGVIGGVLGYSAKSAKDKWVGGRGQ